MSRSGGDDRWIKLAVGRCGIIASFGLEENDLMTLMTVSLEEEKVRDLLKEILLELIEDRPE